jgi:hypothetical protein
MKAARIGRFRLTCFLFGLALIGAGPSYAGAKHDCRRLLDGSLNGLSVTSSEIVDTVNRVWTDRLIREFEIAHLEEFSRRDLTGPKTWRAFSPIWILSSPSSLNQALDYFDPSDGSQTEFAGTVYDWMASWERGYEASIGPIAPSWARTNRRRFLQNLLVEGAVRYSLREAFESPGAFLSTPHEKFPSYSPMTTGIEIAFRGDPGSFQRQFDRVFRRRAGIRLGPSSASVPLFETRLRSGLRAVGVDVDAIGSWKPVVAATYRARTSQQDIQLAVESVRASGNPSTGISALLTESTVVSEGHEQTGFGTEALNAAVVRAGSLGKFFDLVNAALAAENLSEIHPSQGARNFAEEVVIQMAVDSWVRVYGQAVFKGFQALDVDEPFYFEMGNELVQRSGLTMAEINDLASLRLPSDSNQ